MDQTNNTGEAIVCKDCHKTVIRFRDTRRPNAKDVRYINSEGKEFNGRRCPPCHTDKVKKHKYLKNHQKAG